MNVDAKTIERLKSHVNRQRLVETARRLIEVPSPTGDAGAVSDRLAEILAADGFTVERPAGGYPASPAVAIRLESGRPGRTLQFDGHLDTVHLPFVPPAGRGRPAYRQRRLGHESGDRRRRRGGPGAARRGRA